MKRHSRKYQIRAWTKNREWWHEGTITPKGCSWLLDIYIYIKGFFVVASGSLVLHPRVSQICTTSSKVLCPLHVPCKGSPFDTLSIDLHCPISIVAFPLPFFHSGSFSLDSTTILYTFLWFVDEVFLTGTAHGMRGTNPSLRTLKLKKTSLRQLQAKRNKRTRVTKRPGSQRTSPED